MCFLSCPLPPCSRTHVLFLPASSFANSTSQHPLSSPSDLSQVDQRLSAWLSCLLSAASAKGGASGRGEREEFGSGVGMAEEGIEEGYVSCAARMGSLAHAAAVAAGFLSPAGTVPLSALLLLLFHLGHSTSQDHTTPPSPPFPPSLVCYSFLPTTPGPPERAAPLALPSWAQHIAGLLSQLKSHLFLPFTTPGSPERAAPLALPSWPQHIARPHNTALPPVPSLVCYSFLPTTPGPPERAPDLALPSWAQHIAGLLSRLISHLFLPFTTPGSPERAAPLALPSWPQHIARPHNTALLPVPSLVCYSFLPTTPGPPERAPDLALPSALLILLFRLVHRAQQDQDASPADISASVAGVGEGEEAAEELSVGLSLLSHLLSANQPHPCQATPMPSHTNAEPHQCQATPMPSHTHAEPHLCSVLPFVFPPPISPRSFISPLFPYFPSSHSSAMRLVWGHSCISTPRPLSPVAVPPLPHSHSIIPTLPICSSPLSLPPFPTHQACVGALLHLQSSPLITSASANGLLPRGMTYVW
ncbi:unnamed protein product [Closterium sp. NIES-53]